MLEFVDIILAHGIDALQQAHFHFGGRLFLIREFSMTNLMVGRESRIDGRLVGKRMRGQQQPELLLLCPSDDGSFAALTAANCASISR